jgi:nucleotide-binding universal stress UspA family protein
MKKILVALDGSAREQSVLDAAIALGRKTGAELVLFRSVGVPADLPPEAYAAAPEAIPGILEDRARKSLDARRAGVPADIRSRVRTTVGTPWQAIDRVAREEDVDLVVIGSHGYSGVDHLLGTTAAKVVNHVDRSVLVVRAADRLTG